MLMDQMLTAKTRKLTDAKVSNDTNRMWEILTSIFEKAVFTAAGKSDTLPRKFKGRGKVSILKRKPKNKNEAEYGDLEHVRSNYKHRAIEHHRQARRCTETAIRIRLYNATDDQSKKDKLLARNVATISKMARAHKTGRSSGGCCRETDFADHNAQGADTDWQNTFIQKMTERFEDTARDIMNVPMLLRAADKYETIFRAYSDKAKQ